jgi:hypothetical protein
MMPSGSLLPSELNEQVRLVQLRVYEADGGWFCGGAAATAISFDVAPA